MDPTEAKEAALKHDRAYFAAHQFAIRYLRPYIEGEFWPAADFVEGTCVLVVKGERGSRIRTPQEPRKPGEPRRSRMGALDKDLLPLIQVLIIPLPPGGAGVGEWRSLLGKLDAVAKRVADLESVALRYGDRFVDGNACRFKLHS
jgi:hypothetical protein